MGEIIQLTEWKFKFRRSDKRGYYEVIKRKDATYYCSCPSHKYNCEVCKHIEVIKAIGELDEQNLGMGRKAVDLHCSL